MIMLANDDHNHNSDSEEEAQEDYWHDFLGSTIDDDVEDLPQFELASHIRGLRHETDLCDAQLVASDGVTTTTFPVHKLVLAARSQYFKALFYNGRFQPADDNSVILPFDGTTIEAVLSYCYTDTFPNLTSELTKENAMERGRQLVLWSAAAEYLLLDGMIRRLWVWALRMMFQQRHCIPTIHAEAVAHNVEELKTLSKHAFGVTRKEQAHDELEAQPNNDDNSDPAMLDGEALLQHNNTPQETDDNSYMGQGVYVLLGCSNKLVNGEYYANREQSSESKVFENSHGFLIERARTDERGTIGCSIAVKDSPTGKCLYQYWSMSFPPRDHLPHQWEAFEDEDDDEDTETNIPPISFHFRWVYWCHDEESLEEPEEERMTWRNLPLISLLVA